MRNANVLFIIVAGVLLAGNKAEAAHQIQHSDGTVTTVVQMGDPICDTHKCLPVDGFTNETAAASADVPKGSAKPIWRDVVLLQDAQGNYVNFASEWGRCHFQGPRGSDNPYYVDMAYLGIDTPEELRAWCGRKAKRDNRVFTDTDYGIRRSFNGQYIPNHAIVVPGEPNGCLAIERNTDRAICEKVRIERDEARRALAQAGQKTTTHTTQLPPNVVPGRPGVPGGTAAVVVDVPPAPQSKAPLAGSVETAADQETMLVAAVQTKLDQVALGATALLIMALVLLALRLRALRELRQCRGWLEQIRATANVDAETHYRDFAAAINRSLTSGNVALTELRRDILDALAIGSLRPNHNLADMVRAMREKGGVAVSALAEIAGALSAPLRSMGDTETYERQAQGVVKATTDMVTRHIELGTQLETTGNELMTALNDLDAHGDGKCVAQSVHDAAVARLDAAADQATALDVQVKAKNEELEGVCAQLEQRVLRSEFDALDQRVKAQGAEINRLNRMETAMREMHGKAAGLRQLHAVLTSHARVKTSSDPVKAGLRALSAALDVLDANPMPAFAGD